MPVVLALLSSLLWGTSDFLGGTTARRLHAGVVVVLSQGVALLVLLPVALVLGDAPVSAWDGVLAGLVGALGVGAFYAALAAGTMGVVAPIAAIGTAVPVVIGLARGEDPSVLQVAGIAVALLGVVLASGPELSGGASWRPLALALVAAAAFGTVMVLVADGSRGGVGAALVTLLLMRAAAVTATSLVVLTRFGPTAFAGARAGLRPTAVIGVVDVGANLCFAYASRGGLLSVVAVLASLYPVVTVLLARQLHGERLARVQVVGAAGTLVGVALLSAG